MSRRRPKPHRRRESEARDGPISIRVGDKHSRARFHEILTYSARDAGAFARLVDEQTRAHPRDSLIISVNGYQPWLGDVLHSCIEDYWSDISELDREVQFASTMSFPEKVSRRGRNVPWSFIVDHMNVPQVYWWSLDMDAPAYEDSDGLPTMDAFRFRTGVWFCSQGACRFNDRISVTIIFTQQNELSEQVVKYLLFDYLWQDDDPAQPREDEEGVCWTFLKLYNLLTDWQNIIEELNARLDQAELNSRQRNLPVKIRTERMHVEVGRLYEMKDFLAFHKRAIKRLQKLKDTIPKDEQQDPLWGDMDDAVEDLEQFDARLDSLKERFNNLIELEFNITNAVQADNSAFLSAVATLFLPISFLASLFGMTTVTWPAKWYLYIAIPVFIVSAIFTAVFPFAQRRVQRNLYPLEEKRLFLRPNQFTLLGDELPGSVDVPGAGRTGLAKRRKSFGAQNDGRGPRPRSQGPREKG